MWSERITMGAAEGEARGGPGALQASLTALASGALGPYGLLVRDDGVPAEAASRVRAMAGSGTVAVRELVIPGGERGKTWPMISSIYDTALEAGVARDGWFLAVGGGAVSDAVGFAAATYLRGIRWAVVPTTLLGQVDAAIGGKTAIDLPQGKNLVGAFHLPVWVAIDNALLTSLPPREWRSGFGEVLKCALLMGGSMWTRVQETRPGWEDPGGMADLAEAAARYKCRVVVRDPFEKGERVHLNLGHTVGHAWEQVTAYSGPRHGEAVGVGLVAALRLSERHLGLDPEVRGTVVELLRRWGMPVSLPAGAGSRLLPVLGRDKKVRGGRLRWVLLEAIGTPAVELLPPELVEETLYELEA
ncbi:MAG: 3-dehydroquinate synthase [Clostridia bacterium]